MRIRTTVCRMRLHVTRVGGELHVWLDVNVGVDTGVDVGLGVFVCVLVPQRNMEKKRLKWKLPVCQCRDLLDLV